MEADEGLRTVECLRGRLLAERQASRSAKEDAEIMGNKLIELENKLKEETKLRTKAEKRLKFLRKKLVSLNISPSLEESEQSSSSENCAASSVSFSSTSTSATQETDESSKSQNAVPEISKNMEENASNTLEVSLNSEENSNSSKTTESDPKHSSEEKSSSESSSSHEDPTIDDKSSSCLKAPEVETENDMNGRNGNYEDDDYVDNSLALVPLKLPETKQLAPETKIVSKSIGDVLDTLRHARERIQSSLERRRQMIRVGPS